MRVNHSTVPKPQEDALTRADLASCICICWCSTARDAELNFSTTKSSKQKPTTQPRVHNTTKRKGEKQNKTKKKQKQKQKPPLKDSAPTGAGLAGGAALVGAALLARAAAVGPPPRGQEALSGRLAGALLLQHGRRKCFILGEEAASDYSGAYIEGRASLEGIRLGDSFERCCFTEVAWTVRWFSIESCRQQWRHWDQQDYNVRANKREKKRIGQTKSGVRGVSLREIARWATGSGKSLL